MAYKIKRNHIIEQLEIEDNGKVVTLDVDINVDSILTQYNKANLKIAAAQQAAQKAKDERDMQAAELAMGDGVLALFEVIFGEEQTKKILEIYDNRALEMLGDIAPFITDVVKPRIDEAKQRIEDRYKQVNKNLRRVK